MLIQGQHWWFDCFFTTAVNCGVSLLMLFVLHIDLNNTCTMTSRVARRVKAKLRGGRKPLRGKNEMTLRSTVGDWSQGAVEQHAGSGLAAPLKMSCVTETRYYVAAVANLWPWMCVCGANECEAGGCWETASLPCKDARSHKGYRRKKSSTLHWDKLSNPFIFSCFPFWYCSLFFFLPPTHLFWKVSWCHRVQAV